MKGFLILLLFFSVALTDQYDPHYTPNGCEGIFESDTATNYYGDYPYWLLGPFEYTGGGEEPCDSNLIWQDTTKIWCDAIAAQCSLYCDSGTIYFRWTTDTIGEISIDSITEQAAPATYTDTTDTLNPSTAYWISFKFDADTGSSIDSTNWYQFTTKDSSDTSDYWLYEAPGDECLYRDWNSQTANRTKGVRTKIAFPLYAEPTDSCGSPYKGASLTNASATAYHFNFEGESTSVSIDVSADSLYQSSFFPGMWYQLLSSSDMNTENDSIFIYKIDADEIDSMPFYQIRVR